LCRRYLQPGIRDFASGFFRFRFDPEALAGRDRFYLEIAGTCMPYLAYPRNYHFDEDEFILIPFGHYRVSVPFFRSDTTISSGDDTTTRVEAVWSSIPFSGTFSASECEYGACAPFVPFFMPIVTYQDDHPQIHIHGDPYQGFEIWRSGGDGVRLNETLCFSHGPVHHEDGSGWTQTRIRLSALGFTGEFGYYSGPSFSRSTGRQEIPAIRSVSGSADPGNRGNGDLVGVDADSGFSFGVYLRHRLPGLVPGQEGCWHGHCGSRIFRGGPLYRPGRYGAFPGR
jgi:hypothetical protein